MGENKHILGLDLIRFCAAAMVMLVHYGMLRPITMSWAGWIGVEIFFVISGFVITNSAEYATPGGFLKSRLIRLAPSIWICGSVTAAVLFAAGSADLVRRLLNTLVLWPAGPWVDHVYWSLPVEVVFYAAVFVVVAWRLPIEFLLRTLAVASAVFWPIRIWVTSFAVHYPGNLASLTVAYGGEFALGGLLYLSLRDGLRNRSVYIACALMASSLQIAFGPPGEGIPSGWRGAAPLLIWLAFVAAIVASAHWNGAATRLLGRYAKTIRLVGLSTYPLYLLHNQIGLAIFKLGVPIWLVAGVMIAMSICVVVLIERPIQKCLRSMQPADFITQNNYKRMRSVRSRKSPRARPLS